MCANVVLHEAEQCQIVYCRECKQYQVAYLSTLLKFTEQELQICYENLGEIIAYHSGSINPQKKAFAMPTPTDAVYLYYTFTEIEHLHECIGLAFTVRQVHIYFEQMSSTE